MSIRGLYIIFLLIVITSCSETSRSPNEIESQDTLYFLETKSNSTNCDLLSAIKNNDSVLIKNLIINGCDINEIIQNGSHKEDSPFRQAVYYCDTLTLRFMLDHGAEPNLVLKGQMTTFHYSAGMEKEKFALLLEYGGDVNTFCNCNSPTPLLWAIKKNKIENVKTLISKGVIMNPDSINGFHSAFALAISYLRFEIIDLLIENGININAKFSEISEDCICCPDQITVIHKIVSAISFVENKGELFGLLKKLIEHGADINVTNYYGQSPLDFASYGKNIDLVRFLIDNGSDYKNAIYHASKFSNYDVVKVLLEYKVDPNIVLYNNETPLLASLTCCGDGFGEGITYDMRIKTIKLLLEAGADIHVKDNSGNSFYDIVKTGIYNVYEYFIQIGTMSWPDIEFYCNCTFDEVRLVNTDTLEVKLQPNKNSPTLKYLYKNDTVFTTKQRFLIRENNSNTEISWKPIQVNNKRGYVLTDFLKDKLIKNLKK